MELQEALSGERARAKAAEVREAAAATRLDAALRGSAQLKCLLAASLLGSGCRLGLPARVLARSKR